MIVQAGSSETAGAGRRHGRGHLHHRLVPAPAEARCSYHKRCERPDGPTRPPTDELAGVARYLPGHRPHRGRSPGQVGRSWQALIRSSSTGLRYAQAPLWPGEDATQWNPDAPPPRPSSHPRASTMRAQRVVAAAGPARVVRRAPAVRIPWRARAAACGGGHARDHCGPTCRNGLRGSSAGRWLQRDAARCCPSRSTSLYVDTRWLPELQRRVACSAPHTKRQHAGGRINRRGLPAAMPHRWPRQRDTRGHHYVMPRPTARRVGMALGVAQFALTRRTGRRQGA